MKNCIKKFIHKFIVDDRGAVSIYLIIVTLLLFFFNAVLIDYARIIVAERQTDQAAKVALRSTMSSYHQSLQDKGLFAFDGDQSEANAIFKTVFEKNLQPGDGEGFKFVNLVPEEGELTTELNLDRGLANKEILKHQVLEEMKYQAPVEIGEALIEGFLAISDDMEKASVLTEIIGDIEEDVKNRDEKLDEAIELLKSAKEKLDSIHDRIRSTDRNTYPTVNNFADLFYGHLEYIKVYPKNPSPPSDDDDEKSEEELEKEEEDKDKADTFKQNSRSLLNDIIPIAEGAEQDLKDALELLKEAEELNNSVSETIENARDSKGEHYDNAQSENESDVDTGDSSQLDAVLDSVDDYVLDQEMLTNVIQEVEDGIEDMEGREGQTNGLNPKLGEIKDNIDSNFKNRSKNEFGDTGRSGDIYHARLYHSNAKEHTNNAINLLEEGRAEFEDEEMEEKEEEADEALDDLSDQIDEISDAYNDITGDGDIYTKLADLVVKYEGAVESNSEQFELEDKDQTADQAMGFIDILFENLGNLLIAGRDELYFNEYILTRFSHHTFPTDGTSGYKFENNQVEYILYGHHSFGANYMAAMGEIFALRFAINLVDALKKPRSKIFGPYFWVAALADAFLATAENMRVITAGRPVDLIPGKPEPKMTYKDHLRLFLFAHPEGKTTERVMAVLEHETDADLTESSTYITANATTSIELWFIPGIMDMLGHTGALSGRVEGKTYYIDKEVNYAY